MIVILEKILVYQDSNLSNLKNNEYDYSAEEFFKIMVDIEKQKKHYSNFCRKLLIAPPMI